jgi:hypothetical protein
VRVLIAGQLPREVQNAPLHLFSAAPELMGFGQTAYRQRSARTSLLPGLLFERFQEEGLAMAYTMKDFERDVFKKYFPRLSPEDRQEMLGQLLAGLSAEQLEQVRQYLDRQTAERAAPRKSRRKK